MTSVTRANHAEKRTGEYDVVINCAMPAGRFFARQHPERDFLETVEKTADIAYAWTAGKIVQVSSVSARCQLDTVYGRHKAAAEAIVAFGDNLVVRLGPMYDATLSKGVLIDMLHDRTVFASGESRYCFASLDFVARWIASNLHRTGLVEVGARDAIPLRIVAAHLRSRSDFKGDADHQEIECPAPEFPEARDVLAFLDSAKDRLRSST